MIESPAFQAGNLAGLSPVRVTNFKKDIKMTVGQLKKRLKDVDDDILVVRSGPDHSYFETYGTLGKAESNEGGYYEYYGDEHMSEDSVVIDVFIID